ncbi:MAG: hypothetical protein WDZ52_07925 [Pseudohongiellaceae bacterium]
MNYSARPMLVLVCPALLAFFSTLVLGQEITLPNQIWSAEVIRPQGQPVIPLYDGWFPNEDGSKTICFGYFNMNTDEAVDVTIGGENYLATDFPDLDLLDALVPTHFEPLPPRYRHIFCAFTVVVPAQFTANHRVTWHLTSHGQSLSVPGKVLPSYVLDEPSSLGRGDIAPRVSVSDTQSPVRGRSGLRVEQAATTQVNEPLQLSATVEHPDGVVWVGWSHHSGPGEVLFEQQEFEVVSGTPSQARLRISEPGEYIIRMQTIDDTAAFEFYCCHTNVWFPVTVTD